MRSAGAAGLQRGIAGEVVMGRGGDILPARRQPIRGVKEFVEACTGCNVSQVTDGLRGGNGCNVSQVTDGSRGGNGVHLLQRELRGGYSVS